MWKTAWILACKDILLYLRDRTALLLSMGLPIVLVTIFGAAMGTMGGEDSIGRVKILVEDLDQTDRSRALVAQLEKSPGLNVKPQTDVRKRIADGKAPAALLIPSGYGADLARGETPKLMLFRDPGQTIEQQIIAGNLLPAIFETSGVEIGRGMLRRSLRAFGFPSQGIAAAEKMLDEAWSSMQTLASQSADDTARGGTETPSFDFAQSVPQLLGVVVEDVSGGEDPSQTVAAQSHAVAGIAVMMLLFSLVGAGGTILEEQSSGTLQRLQLTPHSGRAILFGKLMFVILIGSAQLVILFLYGNLLFSVPIFRDPLALIVHSFAVACAATGLGLLLAVVCRSRKQLEGLSTLIILAMSALGGSWFPLIATPEWYQKLAHFTLTAWAMDGYWAILWYQKGLADILLPIGILMAIALGTTLLALRGWNRRFALAS